MSVEEKKVAFLLGTHERVGEESPFLRLGSDKDVVRVIFDLAFSKRSLEGFEGILENSFGKKGKKEGELRWAKFLVFDSAGNLVVSDGKNHRLQWFSLEGNFLRSLPLGFEPRGLAFLTEGTLVIADATNHQIRFISVEDGRTLRTIGRGGADEDEFNFPQGVAVHSEQIFVADSDNDRIKVLSNSGDYMRSFGIFGSGEGELWVPTGVAIDPENGNVVVTDSNGGRVVVFSQEEGYLRSFRRKRGDGEINCPQDVAVDCDGNIVVSDCNNHKVQLLSREGGVLKSFGREGEGEGEFNFPQGVAIDEEGRIAVLDTHGSKILIFS